MAKVMTLAGVADSKPVPRVGDCKCVHNPRTGRTVRLCFIGKGKKNRSGWQFQKGASQHCRP